MTGRTQIARTTWLYGREIVAGRPEAVANLIGEVGIAECGDTAPNDEQQFVGRWLVSEDVRWR